MNDIQCSVNCIEWLIHVKNNECRERREKKISGNTEYLQASNTHAKSVHTKSMKKQKKTLSAFVC